MTNTYCCVYIVETPDDGQWICPKHVELFIKNKFVKQCISLAFIIRILFFSYGVLLCLVGNSVLHLVLSDSYVVI
jgi:hypothetical protein